MNAKLLLLVSLWVAAGFLPGRAEVSGALSVEIRIGKAPPPPPPEIVVVEPVGPVGPPPWAGHHWFARQRDYYYYPDCDVYYRPADRMWFYLEGGEWRVGLSLPERIEFDLRHGVRLTMATNRPYIYHPQVVVLYPHDYFRHVRIKDDRDDEPEHDRGGRRSEDGDRGEPGPGKHKGHGKDWDRDR